MPNKEETRSNNGLTGMPVKHWTYSPHAAVENALADVRRRHPPMIPDSLLRMRRLLKQLGNPHLRMPPVFHVAGTNGKGSTLAFVQAALEAAGLRVHKFISPHLVRFEERIVIAGRQIEPDALLELASEVDRAAGEDTVSFFEFFTALGFVAWARHGADALLLETGLGGTFDATNVLDGGVVSLLTRISFDHMHVLGDTLAAIARHKAGIIKPFCPVIVAPQTERDVDEVFASAALHAGAPLYSAGREWRVERETGGFTYQDAGARYSLPMPFLAGGHQLINAGTAIAGLRHSVFAPLMTQGVLAKAMTDVRWPGRMQRLTTGHLCDLLPAGWELWLDGAHNDSGAEVLGAQADAWGGDKPLHLIAAFKNKKNPDVFFQNLKGRVATVQAVEAEFDAPMMQADVLCAHLRRAGFAQTQTASGLENALRALTFQFDAPQRIVITGSLYLVGYALRLNGAP